jgi:hypothetical protein
MCFPLNPAQFIAMVSSRCDLYEEFWMGGFGLKDKHPPIDRDGG